MRRLRLYEVIRGEELRVHTSGAFASAPPAEITPNIGTDTILESQTSLVPPPHVDVPIETPLSVPTTITATIEVTEVAAARPLVLDSKAQSFTGKLYHQSFVVFLRHWGKCISFQGGAPMSLSHRRVFFLPYFFYVWYYLVESICLGVQFCKYMLCIESVLYKEVCVKNVCSI